MRAILAVTAALLLVGSASAQFVNPDFETGNLNGWTVRALTNGQTAVQDVVDFDIDDAGPLPLSKAARFSVGQVTFQSGVWTGIEFVQSLNLVNGQNYNFAVDVAAWREPGGPGNAQGGNFEFIVGNTVVANYNVGSVTAGITYYSHLAAPYTATSTGPVDVGLRITRPYVPAGGLYQFVDNFVPEPASFVLLALATLLRRR